MKKNLASLLLAGSTLAAVPAFADGTIRIGYVDPLSGAGANVGQIGLDELNFIAARVNGQGGVLGKKIEIIPYDNQVNPQVSIVQVQKAIDDGVKIITQGNGSSVGLAIEAFVTKYNKRNPGADIVYLNYGAIDPTITNQHCSPWQFAFDANSDMKVDALTSFMKTRKDIGKIYLIDQDYSFGRSVASAAEQMLKAKRPDVTVVGDEFVPLLKVNDFSPYIAKIKASGADTVITSNWGQDLTLLIKAAGQAGLKVKWFTFYAGFAGGPLAIKQAGLGDEVFQINEGFDNLDYAPARAVARAYIASHPADPIFYPKLFNETGALFDAIRQAKSDDPAKFAPILSGMKYPVFSSGEDGIMRSTDHQFLQPLYISVLGPLGPNEPFDTEHTGWGWKKVAEIPITDSTLPTACHMEPPGQRQ